MNTSRLNESELRELMLDLESDRVERTVATNNMDKFCIAACCFANDYPQHKKPGYLLIGVDDKGKPTGYKVTDQLVKTLGEVRANEFALRFFPSPYEMTIFPDGRAIIKGTADIGVARSLYAKFVGT